MCVFRRQSVPPMFLHWGFSSKLYFMQGKREQQLKDSEEIAYFSIVAIAFTLVMLIISTLFETL